MDGEGERGNGGSEFTNGVSAYTLGLHVGTFDVHWMNDIALLYYILSFY